MAEAPYGEENTVISFGGGLFTADLPSAIPENYCSQCDNAVPTGTSVENRFAFRKSTVAFSEISKVDDERPSFTYFGPSRKPDNPVMMWGQKFPASSGSNPSASYSLHLLREGSPYQNVGGANGYFSVSTTAQFIGAVNYNDVIYTFYTDKIVKITAINWTAPSITSATVLNTPTLMETEPIHFFDRLWVASGNTLYFTDAVSSPGGLPETWNTSTNFIKVVGKNGTGKIFKIIPVGSRIFLFTSVGLFSLTVAGSPEDWYMRPLDEKAIVNTYECAFEQGGLIYYTTIYGVYVTNGSDSVKLSGSIENFFLVGNFGDGPVGSKQSNLYRLNYLDGGMVLSITALATATDMSTDVCFDSPNSFVLYTRISSIAWSEWAYDTTGFDNKLIGVVNVADAVLSYINATPLSYAMVLTSWSHPGAKNPAQKELMVYDGLRDEWTSPGWNQSTPPTTPTTSADIVVKVATRYFDGGSAMNYKIAKYGFLQVYCSDPEKLSSIDRQWLYEWHTEDGLQAFESTAISDDNYDVIKNLGEFLVVKVRAGFNFRIGQFYFEFNTNNSETIKVKDLFLKQDTIRDGPYFLQ